MLRPCGLLQRKNINNQYNKNSPPPPPPTPFCHLVGPLWFMATAVTTRTLHLLILRSASSCIVFLRVWEHVFYKNIHTDNLDDIHRALTHGSNPNSETRIWKINSFTYLFGVCFTNNIHTYSLPPWVPLLKSYGSSILSSLGSKTLTTSLGL